MIRTDESALSDSRNSQATPVAVLMAVYSGDRADLFARALDSVLSQSVGEENVRVYLGVDGPIGDELEAVVLKYGARIFRVVRSASNRGLGVTLNALVDCLEDEQFLFRMDADDVSHFRRFELQLAALTRLPTVDVLGTAIEEVSPSGEVLSTRRYPGPDANIARYISRGSPVAHPTVCFRRRFFSIVGHGYRDVGGYNDDLALWFDALERGAKIASIPDVLYSFLIDDRFYGRRSLKKSVSELRIFSKGLFALHGLTPLLLYPVVRFMFRLMPSNVARMGYRAGVRRALLNQ